MSKVVVLVEIEILNEDHFLTKNYLKFPNFDKIRNYNTIIVQIEFWSKLFG